MTDFARHFAVFTEYERGWGSKVFHIEGYDTREDAEKAIRECNSKNTAPVALDYYIMASYSTDLNLLASGDYVDCRKKVQKKTEDKTLRAVVRGKHGNMELSVEPIAMSVGAENGVKIGTMKLIYPRPVLAEFNTHRVFSRNGQSSRAVPFKRMVEALRENYHSPFEWLKNQPGMVATEVMSDEEAAVAQMIWEEAMEDAIRHATRLNNINASKQYVNRLLEPWMMTRTLVTSTRFANFFKLRDHKDAIPEFRELAAMMKEVWDKSDFISRSANDPVAGWHMPFIQPEDFDTTRLAAASGIDAPFIPRTIASNKLTRGHDLALDRPELRLLLVMSSARCCRLSYETFDGTESTLDKDLSTFTKLATDPLHASPMEHIAFPLTHRLFVPAQTGNFHGFRQFRKMLPNEAVEEAVF